ncbi:MAG: DUF2807 domain-containing protein [Deltaproteobacteria bacterium]|nr:DUF2807 domain-containing protein [Deltaproteobacteria bacterium]
MGDRLPFGIGAAPLFLFFLLLLGLSGGCSATPGNGNVTTQVLPSPAAFTGIVARRGFLVEVVSIPGATPSIEVTIDENLQSKVDIRVALGVLIIDSDDIAPTVAPIVRATTDGLATISSNGPGTTVMASGAMAPPPGDAFAVGASEGGAVEVTGTCTDLVAIVTGPSVVRAGGLACERGDLEVLGDALLEVQLSESARIRGSGPSTVRISGSPATVEENVNDEVTVIVE